jgi:hypothetical protein
MSFVLRGRFRRDLALAPGPGFRLRRRSSARLLSFLLPVIATGWGVFDLWAGHRLVGVVTAVLAVAFVVQFVQAEQAGWSFEGTELRSRRLRLAARDIEGVHLASSGRSTRAWVQMRDGEQVALMEGEEREVRRIADRLSGLVRLATMPSRANLN